MPRAVVSLFLIWPQIRQLYQTRTVYTACQQVIVAVAAQPLGPGSIHRGPAFVMRQIIKAMTKALRCFFNYRRHALA